MEWGNHLLMLAALALCILPLLKWLSESLSGSGKDEPISRDIWAKPVPALHFYAKLAALFALVFILMLNWIRFMIETFTP